MDIAKRLNRDFYIKMRMKGYSHESLVSNVFPPERTDKFKSDVEDLKDIDFTKKVDIDSLVYGEKKETKSNQEIKKKSKASKKEGSKNITLNG